MKSGNVRIVLLIHALLLLGHASQAQSIARVWNEAALDAIRIDFPHPPVHARNLFGLSAAMYDAWAAFDSNATGYAYNDFIPVVNVTSARHEAISFAAYRVLHERYSLSVNSTQTLMEIGTLLTNLGYSADNSNAVGNAPAAVGNRAAKCILDFSREDGSLQTNAYSDPSYAPVNDPMILALGGTTLNDPNRWQPLAFDFALTQNGLVADKVQVFVGSQWISVRPFALRRSGQTNAYLDPGPPPMIHEVGEEEYKTNNVIVLWYSSLLDPDTGTLIDISPGGPGKNNVLGTHDGTGHPTNPLTGTPYPSNVVNLADFGRVAAEIWADGPDSETPPGHWNTIANQVSDHPLFTRQFEGAGPSLDPLEWDVKIYFAINGALHDAATASWTAKRIYDYIRPITTIRWLGGNGQCSDPMQPSYHTNGLPLVSNLIEVVTTNSTMTGQRHEHLAGTEGEIVVNTWPGEPDDPMTEYSGRQWIMATNWLPYQRNTFVTPAFAGYVSGHSTFSRAAAEVLTLMTGDPFFPGGVSSYTAAVDSLLFELGPTTNIVLQWGTYYDASDEAGISRLYGGIHVPVDDFPGRIMGSQAGIDAYNLARKYFDGSIENESYSSELARNGSGLTIDWPQVIGMSYRITSTTNLLQGFTTTSVYDRAVGWQGSLSLSNLPDRIFYRIERKHEK